jgi:urease accessory protein
MSIQFTRLAAAAALLAFAAPAAAHTGSTPVVGFVSGFLHPLGGLDHVLAMVAVGVLAAMIGGRALWLVPASFLGAMAVGSVLGVSLPFVELGIVASVVVLGAVVALAPRMPVAVAMALAAAFAVFHGHAHGTEMPAAASALPYGLGFLFGTALLHAAGLGLGLVVERLSRDAGRAALRVGGGAVAALGLALLVV